MKRERSSLACGECRGIGSRIGVSLCLIAALASLVAGCALLPAVGSSPNPSEFPSTPPPTVPETASPQATSTPEPSILPTAVPSLATATPINPSAEKARSDAFWEALVGVGALYNFEYDSLADISADVDLIVRGRIADVYIAPDRTGEEELDTIWATVAVEDILKGEPITRNPGTIEVMLWFPGQWDTVRTNVPSEDALFFLMYDTADAIRRGDDIRNPEWSRYTYWRPNDQAVLRNIDGRVSVIARDEIIEEWGPDRFPVPLEGQPFDDVVSQAAALSR